MVDASWNFKFNYGLIFYNALFNEILINSKNAHIGKVKNTDQQRIEMF